MKQYGITDQAARLALVLLLVVGALWLAPPALAQGDRGTITGTVTDGRLQFRQRPDRQLRPATVSGQRRRPGLFLRQFPIGAGGHRHHPTLCVSLRPAEIVVSVPPG